MDMRPSEGLFRRIIVQRFLLPAKDTEICSKLLDDPYNNIHICICRGKWVIVASQELACSKAEHLHQLQVRTGVIGYIDKQKVSHLLLNL
jgi:hypothetical protein